MKAYEWNIVKRSEGKSLTPIPTNEVAFIGPNDERLIISVDKYTGMLSIYKSGYGDDEIIIKPQSINKILIK